jgi:hypothetical protein
VNNNEKSKVLIIYGYHVKEIFAIETGEFLQKKASENLRVVRYESRCDCGNSTYYLRSFAEKSSNLAGYIA